MEKKLEIIESNSEVSKDKLWLKPTKEGMSLLHYGSNGRESVLGKAGNSIPSLKDIPDSELKKLSLGEIFDILNRKKNNIPLMTNEEYLQSINILRPTVASWDIKSIIKYYQIHKGNKTYKEGDSTVDELEVIPIIPKGSMYKLCDINPDLYMRAKEGINTDCSSSIIYIAEGGLSFFNEQYILQQYIGDTFVIKNDTEVIRKGVSLSDLVELLNKSTENGCTEVQDGFRPRLKGDALYIDDNLNVLEYHSLRSIDNIIQECGKSILLSNKNKELEEFKVIKKDGFTLRDFYLCFGNIRTEEDSLKYRDTILKFVEKKTNYILLDAVVKNESYQDEDGNLQIKSSTNIKKGDVIVSSSLPHIFFTIIDSNIPIEDLKNLISLIDGLYFENYYKCIDKYYPPYENYKYIDSIENYKNYKSSLERAKENATKLETLLDKLKDKIQYKGEIVTTAQIN